MSAFIGNNVVFTYLVNIMLGITKGSREKDNIF